MPRNCKYIALFIASVLLLSTQARAHELTGLLALDSRAFVRAPAFDQQSKQDGVSLVIEPEYYHSMNNENDVITFRPFARVDTRDAKRNHFDIRQLDWLHVHDDWEVRVGASKVFWGVTESNHLVDIINQTDSVEDVDGEDKLGQPMLQVGLFKDWGSLRLFYLPYFRERTFVSKDARLRGPKPIETDITLYEAPAKRWNPDVALRYEHTLGDWDFGLGFFAGNSREPRLVEATNADGGDILRPAYDVIQQTSLDVQYTLEGWLWKLEAISRFGHDRHFVAASGGVEYTFYSVFDSTIDVGVLNEYLFDERSSNAPGTFAQNDSFVGVRLTFNDTQDSELLAGAFIDHDSQATFASVEAARRIGDRWKVELDLRGYFNISQTAPEAGLRKDHHAQLRLARYF